MCFNIFPYNYLTKNNLDAVRNDMKGARCIHCLGYPNCYSNVLLKDTSTIICPKCGVDAVIPASFLPDEETLYKWQKIRFPNIKRTFKYGPDETTETILKKKRIISNMV
tara:strand:- start:1235 stop:1561 length:327 start_codon:yes stop_codon:yes gene_type:complete